jgi:hypothetical protein
MIFAALLQAAASHLTPPAPPPPAWIGGFTCDVREQSGAAYSVSGELREWRRGRGISDTGRFSIRAPASSRLAGDYDATLTGNLMVITNQQQRLNGTTQSLNRIILDGPRSGEGTIMIKSVHTAPDRDEQASSVGFCAMAFRTAG